MEFILEFRLCFRLFRLLFALSGKGKGRIKKMKKVKWIGDN